MSNSTHNLIQSRVKHIRNMAKCNAEYLKYIQYMDEYDEAHIAYANSDEIHDIPRVVKKYMEWKQLKRESFNRYNDANNCFPMNQSKPHHSQLFHYLSNLSFQPSTMR